MNRSELQRMPEGAPVDVVQVGLKGRPLCAGVSVPRTMRFLRGKVDRYRKGMVVPNAARAVSFFDQSR